MDKSFIEKLENMMEAKAIEIDGITYSNKRVFPVEKPTTEALCINSLAGIVDYIKSDIDSHTKTDLFILIEDHRSVVLLSNLFGETKQRNKIIHAEYEPIDFTYGYYYTVEEMVIKLKTCFVDTEMLRKAIQIVGNIKDEAIATMVDDGMSQQVTVKAGVSRIDNIVVPNPISLKPYRSFYDVDQPESDFLLRMKKGPEMPMCALFTADGGRWQQTARQNIKNWLKGELPDIHVIE